jgi:TPR repeat protein
VSVQSSAVARKGTGALAKRGLDDLQSHESAVAWFKKAQGLYNAVPKEFPVTQFRSSLGEFFKCLQRAAILDPQHSGIQSWLGAAYKDGLGTEKDLATAAKWFRKAADQGVAGAQYELAEMFMYGEGVPQDSSEAARLHKMAADQGNIDAQLALGVAYADGSGLTKDLTESAHWFRRAAEQGSDIGQYFLAEAFAEGRGVPKNSTEAAKWYRKAASQGMAEAQSKLGHQDRERS